MSFSRGIDCGICHIPSRNIRFLRAETYFRQHFDRKGPNPFLCPKCMRTLTTEPGSAATVSYRDYRMCSHTPIDDRLEAWQKWQREKSSNICRHWPNGERLPWNHDIVASIEQIETMRAGNSQSVWLWNSIPYIDLYLSESKKLVIILGWWLRIPQFDSLTSSFQPISVGYVETSQKLEIQ